MTGYLKSLAPFAAAVVVCLVDKLVAADAIPDAVWLTLFGAAPVVAAVPNKTKTGSTPEGR